MHLLTVVNREDPGLELWRHTAKLHGHTPHVLWAPKNVALGHASKWFGQKFVTLHAHVQTLPREDLCLVTDGFDVAIVDTPQNIECKVKSVFAKTLARMLFAAEVFENPDKGNPYDLKRTPFPFLNSGVYAATAGTIADVLGEVVSDPNVLQLDDQRFFTQLFFSKPGFIALDHKAEVFACLAGFKDFKVGWHTLEIEPTRTFPSVLHFQGFYKNTLGVLPQMFPSDEKIHALARKLHRMPNLFTPIGDAIAWIGRPFPFGDKAPFVVGLVVLASLLSAGFFDVVAKM